LRGKGGGAASTRPQYAFLPNWTAKVEYLYVNLGTLNCTAVGCGGPGLAGNTLNLTENVVRAGVNFKFW
jgi:outer membrane immunogenic protein